jgi:hypothetical protein
MANNNQQKQSNALKNLDFIAWQISREKNRLHREEANRVFNDRPRQRDKGHLN